MKRCSFCEWIPILPWPVWPLAEQCSLGQNVVVGSMLVLQVALGNVPRGVCLDPRLHYKCTSPRLPAELPFNKVPVPKAQTETFTIPDRANDVSSQRPSCRSKTQGR